MSHIVSIRSASLRALRSGTKCTSYPHHHHNNNSISNVLSTSSTSTRLLSTSVKKAVSEQTLASETNPQYAKHKHIYFLDNSVSVTTPAFPESVKDGTIRLLKKVGDKVQVDETIAEIETDKTNLQVNAPQSGTIEAVLVEDGSNVTAGAELFKISEGGGDKGEAKPSSSATPKESKKDEKPPSIRKTEHQEDEPSKPQQSSKKQADDDAGSGKMPSIPPVPKTPIRETPTSQIPVTPLKPSQQQSQSSSGADPNKITGTRTETRVKMSRMRLKIAERLKEAQNTCAMLTTFNEIDMSNVVDLRKKFADNFIKRHNLKLGFMSAFVKASACALQDQPVANAVVDGNEIVYRDYVDISVAVATPKGLVVPVLRNVEKMSYADIERSINDFGEKAKKGSLSIEDMDGGTFTISNGGVFGSLFGTPIINPPQSAILGMHGIFDRPVAINGKIEIRPMMYVALTYDHRLLDGRDAVLFLRKIKQNVEDPRAIFLDI
ncbi:unnamed protein product [Didymodactylos carnosus]|uniref:Dihydrolipoyllysine-residue succinyltransferase component of 2-oxoglutarate dehydrogenase complex, mitochondrial n=1 Tax=Didymodactylos carnosus TaxID=1234261 RepID=A0A814ND00_9BILA|nr:unnamed protein product [Didymodactylos carnosus]CAF1091868.1 unnamed protein product [Didymodactylos carnosus]CAF1091872.1 unnamed protein product [Didymodactylos carnosus]CAF3738498.1 unnamed protein product [Didymodactylos carnosus]CAF3857348.1 unnamed protein product [Didymodactylos carnosus]